MFIKENFWVGAKGGLLDERHYLCMRDSVWLFLFLLLKQTSVNEAGEGVVNYGHPITRMEIQEQTGYHERRVEDWIERLRRTSYIRTEPRGNEGLIFFVKSAKNKHKVSRNNVPPKPEVSRNNVPRIPQLRATCADKPIKNEEDTLPHTSITPKDLSSSNKDAASNPDAGVSISKLAKAKAIPRAFKSHKELDAERRRQLDAMRAKGYLQ
jgi:hypothetical protein